MRGLDNGRVLKNCVSIQWLLLFAIAVGVGYSPTTTAQLLGLTACQPSGLGTDYQVGDGKQYTSLDQVPWPNLAPGDTVRIFYRAATFKGKMLITATGTAAAPVRICGVKGPNGERPIIDGRNAVARTGMNYGVGGSTVGSTSWFHQVRSVIVIKNLATDFFSFPAYIQIDGLAVTGAHPNYQFTDTNGAVQTYTAFGACIWVDRGHNIVIADNEIYDCSQGLYTKSTDDGQAYVPPRDFSVTKNLRVAGNIFSNNGIVGAVHEHHSYTAGSQVVIEYNRFLARRAGSMGNSVKDRSIGTVVRYNRIEDGARAIDLVEAEDFPITALADPAYRKTFVYGNQIIKDGTLGSTIHYGGDHNGATPTSNYGEPFNRKGTLYFFNNTIRLTGTTTGSAVLFQLSTTEETAEVWNNIFMFDPTIQYPSMRSKTDVGPAYTSGGIVNLGKNWIVSNWADNDPFRVIPGQLNGSANMITGTTFPVDPLTFLPDLSSVIVDAATAPPAAAASSVVAYPVNRQLDLNFAPQARFVRGAAMELGAIELATPPGAPTNVLGTAGNGQATISFSASASGDLPVTRYNVTCNSGTITATGMSPVTLPNLTNGSAYTCSVTATNGDGTSPSSATVSVTPQLSVPLALVDVRSRKVHGAAGPFGLPITPGILIGGLVTVEPRVPVGGLHTLVFQFNGPVSTPGTAQVTPVGAASAVATGSTVVVTLVGIVNNMRATVTLTDVNGVIGLSPAVSLGFLVGDVNNTRMVNSSDISGVKSRAQQPLDMTNYLFDLNASGTITSSDISIVKARSGLLLP